MGTHTQFQVIPVPLFPSMHNECPPTVISPLTLDSKAWIRQTRGTESLYVRAIVSTEALMAKAKALARAWMKVVANKLPQTWLSQHPTQPH